MDQIWPKMVVILNVDLWSPTCICNLNGTRVDRNQIGTNLPKKAAVDLWSSNLHLQFRHEYLQVQRVAGAPVDAAAIAVDAAAQQSLLAPGCSASRLRCRCVARATGRRCHRRTRERRRSAWRRRKGDRSGSGRSRGGSKIRILIWSGKLLREWSAIRILIIRSG